MVENIGRKLATIIFLLAASAGLLFLKDKPFTLGLDLQGGTRLTLQIDFDQAVKDGTLTAAEAANPQEVLSQMIGIFRDRIDPNGVLEPIIHSEGDDRIVIELPGVASLGGKKAVSTLAGDLDASGQTLILGEGAIDFPEEGGVVRIGSEDVRYRMRAEGSLLGLQRGIQSTTKGEHKLGEEVVLVSNNAIRNAIENLGNLAFTINVEANDLVGKGTDLTTERNKLTDWIATNPAADVVDFNTVSVANGGPHPVIEWYVEKDDALNSRPQVERATPVLRQANFGHPNWVFTGQALAQAYASQDDLGRPAVGFKMKTPRVGDFTDFTDEYTGRDMSIILNGVIESTARINGVLPGSGQIYGQFTPEYVNTLITVLRTGSLKIKPTIVSDERVGATLGADYVKIGLISCLLAIMIVLVFMVIYYRRLGVMAAIGLVSTLLMLLGALSFIDATLTLPGVAGIILTVGMAVDANILIFDRIREEMDNGRNIKQASKNGFSRAAITIFDANITTLITAVILYNVGTGPVKGFAVTLMIGVLTSMFAALVIVKVLMHYSLERGLKSIPMGRWLVTANYQFMNKAKMAMGGSAIAIALGLALFIWIPTKDKMSIDFLGGAAMQIRTAQPETVEKIKELIALIPGDIRNSEVKPVLSESDGAGTYSSFRITFKTEAGKGDEDTGSSFKNQIGEYLKDVLLTEPLLVSIDASSTAEVLLHFGESHELTAVQTAVLDKGIQDPTVSALSGEGAFRVVGKVSGGITATDLASTLQRSFEKSGAFTLAEPVPDYSEVGSQVVGELRDKAILAILISLFAIVMYIRVRFAEYSYGIAAVAAVIHDVLITLGVLSVFMVTGLVQVEISVALIAAFLTIIGYSLNDTIVLFDRVRENLPRMEAPLSDVLDASINVTLSRTILTSLTTFIAVAVLLAFNLGTGNVLEGFALTMVIGVFVGTYSSVFIASPVLLVLEKRAIEHREKRAAAAAH